MKNEKILPFANETQKLKNDFKKMIDEMSDDEFRNMLFLLMTMDLDEDFDAEFDEEYVEDFEDSFSGEMVNFKCTKCNKISAYPIEIVNEIYEARKKEPQMDCYYCENHYVSPIYYNTPDGEIFGN